MQRNAGAPVRSPCDPQLSELHFWHKPTGTSIVPIDVLIAGIT
jgi:hypothetical protein